MQLIALFEEADVRGAHAICASQWLRASEKLVQLLGELRAAGEASGAADGQERRLIEGATVPTEGRYWDASPPLARGGGAPPLAKTSTAEEVAVLQLTLVPGDSGG